LTSASEEEFFHVKREFQYAIVVVCILCLLVAVGLGLYTGNGIVRPLNRVVSMLQGIATGEADLTARLPMASGKGKPDEIGELSLAFNTFIGNLERLIRSIQGNAETIGHASLNMDRISGEMALAVLPEYQTVGVCHEEVHARAEKVVALHNQGETEEARAELRRFNEARDTLFAILDELYLCQGPSSRDA